MTLVCACGQKLGGAGATPGRVGKCPRCGSFVRVPEVDRSPEPGIGPNPEPVFEVGAPIVAGRRAAVPARSTRIRPVRRGGLTATPTRPETSLLASLAYPFRGDAGLGLLVMLPPLLWFGAVPLTAAVPLLLSGSPAGVFGLILGVPQLLLLGIVLGHALLFLGDVVVSSCLGDAALPRPAGWNPGEIVSAWGRWIWALLVGGGVGGLPALLYWFEAGDIDWFDRVVLVDLALPGLAYAQMALVLTLVRETPWAIANPVLVIGSIGRAGWGYVRPCVVSGSALLVLVGLLMACFEMKAPVAQAVVFWSWWTALLYLAVIALRVLGLHCHRSGAVDL